MLQCVIGLTRLFQSQAESEVRFGMVGRESQGLAKVVDGLGKLALSLERYAQVEVRFGIAGVEPQRLKIVADRLVKLALYLE